MRSKFIERYENMYALNEDGVSDDRIEMLERITIQFDEEDECCHIFASFYFDDQNEILSLRRALHEQILFIQQLGKLSGENPEINYIDTMGCPFTEEEVGFFNIPKDWKRIDKLLSCFSSIADGVNVDNIDIEYIDKNYKSLYDEYVKLNTEIESFFLNFLGKTFISPATLYHNILNKNDLVYINREKTAIVGFSKSGLTKMSQMIKERFYKANKFFFGVDYSFAMSDKINLTINSNLLNGLKYILEQLGTQYVDENIFYINSKYLLFTDDEQHAWFLLSGYHGEQEKFFLKEKNALEERYNKVCEYLPSDIAIADYNYEKLTAVEFENMCHELLYEIGFINVRQRGKTNDSDGGVDIEADAQIKTPFGDELQHWIFQCKHTKRQLSRKALLKSHCS